jgi:hypothetical protein
MSRRCAAAFGMSHAAFAPRFGFSVKNIQNSFYSLPP